MRPFQSDGEYLACEFEWLRARKRTLDETIPIDKGDDGAERDVAALRAHEARLRDDIDRRLAAHRVEGTFRLGLDCLCESHGLDEDERVAVLVLTPCAIAAHLGDDVLTGGAAWMTGGELLWWLGPKDVQEWLRLRTLFEPGGRLRQAIVEVRETSSELGAAATLSGFWFLSESAFRVVAGVATAPAVR